MRQVPYLRSIKDNASRYVQIIGSSTVANHVGFSATEKYRKLFGRAPSVILTEIKVHVQTQSKDYKFDTVHNFFTAPWSNPYIFERNPMLVKSESELAPRPLPYRVVLHLLLAFISSYRPNNIANLLLHTESTANTSIRSPYPQCSLKYTAAAW